MYMHGLMIEVKMGTGRVGIRFIKERREWGLNGVLDLYNLVLFGISEKFLRMMIRRFVGVCKRRKSSEGDGARKGGKIYMRGHFGWESIGELWFAVDESSADGVECCIKW